MGAAAGRGSARTEQPLNEHQRTRTIVAGTRIGGHRAGGTAELHHGDQIVVGTTRSRYIFRFAVDASDQG